MDKLIAQLKRHEGFESNYYYCTGNKKTIGHGHNVDDNPFTDGEIEFLGRTEFELEPMTLDEANYLLEKDVIKCAEEITKKHGDDLWFSVLYGPRADVCINMCFQMGVSGFGKFKKMIHAIETGSYQIAANEMLDSRWAKQTPNRAKELAIQMSTGRYKNVG